MLRIDLRTRVKAGRPLNIPDNGEQGGGCLGEVSDSKYILKVAPTGLAVRLNVWHEERAQR